LEEGPQIITKRGAEAAVLVSIEEWRRVHESSRPTLKDLLMTDFARGDIPIPSRGRWKPRAAPELR
jgi:antitoxin Phd